MAFLRAAPPEWRVFLLTAIRTGLRRGELFELRWGDLQLVQQWLGHANIATTERYAHLAPDTGEDLIDLLDAPKSAAGEDVRNFTNTTTNTNGSQDAKNAV